MSTPTKVVSVEPRLADRARGERRARRSSALRRAGWVLAGVAPFVLVGWLLIASPWLVVHHVVVKGVRTRLTAAQVLKAADVRLGTPLAKVDTGAVAARVRELAPVASVTVTRGWPDTLELTVVERQPVVAVAVKGRWLLLDGSGASLGTAAAVPPGLVRLAVKNAKPDDAATTAALTVLRALPKVLRAQVAAVSAPSPEQVTLVLVNRKVVIWGGTADASAKAAALIPLLRMPGRVYDVSSPTVVTRR